MPDPLCPNTICVDPALKVVTGSSWIECEVLNLKFEVSLVKFGGKSDDAGWFGDILMLRGLGVD